jgi:CxxC motif-containing protein (DUF1111 family)
MKEHNRKFIRVWPAIGAASTFVLIGVLGAVTTCQSGTSCDVGPRPVGNQSAAFTGPVDINGAPLLPKPVIDTRQPPDANGNEGAGQVLRQAGAGTAFWFKSTAVFGQLTSVNGAVDPASGNPTLAGLGPAFNGTSCFMCHSQPAIGGSSPGVGTPGFTQNPQLTVAKDFGAANPEDYSAFLQPNGPVREVRFILDETDRNRRALDGGVHGLFTIQGRIDAPAGCTAAQPDITTQLANNNVIFRIPTPTFGLGLVENVSDEDLISNASSENSLNPSVKNGVLNRSGNDGTVARFGWKAQNKSLLVFAGEAANAEMGMTNELFPNERASGTNCATNQLPEDQTRDAFPTGKTPQDVATFVSSSIENFTIFMRLNGAPSQCDFASGVDSAGNALCNPLGDSAQNGLKTFNAIGCSTCHTQNFTTKPSNVDGLSNRTFQPFSDFAVHHMGVTLADGVTQGLAGPDQFRTAPLWGLGQRLFFLHDGRTADLKQAILAHASSSSVCFTTAATQVFTVTFPLNNNATAPFNPQSTTLSCGSEANGVIDKFKGLTVAQQQDLLNFLRSL